MDPDLQLSGAPIQHQIKNLALAALYSHNACFDYFNDICRSGIGYISQIIMCELTNSIMHLPLHCFHWTLKAYSLLKFVLVSIPKPVYFE